MKQFSILVLLLAALTAVNAIPGPHAFGLLARDDDDGCLSGLYGRAIIGSSSAAVGMTSVTSAPTSSDKTITSTVDTYITVPCSDDTDIGASTTTVSKHTTSTDLITVTITSSSSTSISSSVFTSITATTLSTALILIPASSSSTASTSSSASTFSSSYTSSIAGTSNSGITSSTVSSSSTSSSTSSVGGVSTSATSSMAYVPPSYGVGSTTGLQTYSGIAMLSSTSSVDALSATPISSSPAVTTIITESIVPLAPNNPSSASSLITLTSSSTSTRTTTINVGLNPSYTSPNYNGALSSVLASISYISSIYHPTAIVVATPSTTAGTEACSPFSTLFVTVTLPSATSGSNSGVPANPLDSQLHTSAASSAVSAVSGPQYTASTDALSGSITHATTSVPTAAASNATGSSNNTVAPLTSPFLTPASNSSNTAPTVRGKKHINVALVLYFVGALVMFAV